MMKAKQKLSLKLIGLCLLIFFIQLLPIPAYVHAQSDSSQYLQVQGLAVSPFLIETDIEPGVSQKHNITITNTTDQALTIDVSINDFVPDSAGQAKFLDVDAAANPAYALSSWISVVQQPLLVIPPKAQTELIFSITPPLDAVPGTHYGGLLFSTHPKVVSPGATEVTQKVGVIVLAKFGHGHEEGDITHLLAEQGGDSFRFLLSFYNSGNVHLKPKGDINITDIFGREVGSVAVNRDADIILPENQKIFESFWKPGWRFGRYKATAILYFGNPKIEVRANTIIWIIPIKQIIVLLVLLVLIGSLLRIVQRRYNRYIIRRSKSENTKKR